MNGQSFINMQIAIAALYIIYPLFISGRVAHKYARCYLLSIFPLAAIIAIVQIPFWSSPSSIVYLYDAQIEAFAEMAPLTIEQATNYVPYLYWGGVMVMGLWFLVAVVKVLHLLWSIKAQNGIRYMEKGCAFSFFGAIFISTKYKGSDVESMIVHERCHSSYLHSIDVVYCNLCRAMLWFNPFAWLVFHSLRQVHEWQADAYVIKAGVNKIQYIDLLLEAGSATNVQVVNLINYSLTKKRIIMIAKNQKRSAMRLITALPVVAALTLSMSLTAKATPSPLDAMSPAIQSESPVTTTEQMPQFTIDKKGVEGFRDWIMKNLKFDTPMNGVQGRVIVNFTIETDGAVSNVKVVRGINEKVDNAIVDQVAKSPKWAKPAYKDGVVVKFTFTLPIDVRAK